MSAASFWAAVAPPSGVHRPSSVRQRMSWSEKLAALVVDRDLDAALRVLTEGRVGAGQDAPVRDVDRLAGRDRRRCRAGRSDGAAAPPRAAGADAANRSAAAPSAASPNADASRALSSSVIRSRPYTRPIMIDCTWALPRRAPGRTPDRPSSPAIAVPSRTALQVQLVRRRVTPRSVSRAARRWPPKRCRIISAASRMQHRSAAPGAVVELYARRSWRSWPRSD